MFNIFDHLNSQMTLLGVVTLRLKTTVIVCPQVKCYRAAVLV